MGWRISILIVLLNAFSASAQFDKAEAAVRKALARNKPYKAIAKAEGALSKKDAPAIFHVLRAEGYNRIGSYTKALKDAKAAQGEMEVDLELRSQFIGAYLGLDQLDSAMRYLGEQDPNDPRITESFLYGMGVVYQRSERWSDALGVFDQGVKRFPDSARLVRERGACHAMLGDSANARMDFDRAIALAPRDAANYNSRGYYRYALFGDHAGAIADMDRAIKQDPNYAYAFSNRGWSRFKLGDGERARKDLLLALKKDPDNAYAYRSLGIVTLSSGDTATACGYFQRALEFGFSERYGTEAEELVSAHCGEFEPMDVPPPVPTNVPVPPSNAPGGRTTKPGNAP